MAYNSALAKKVSNGDATAVNDSELRDELSSYSEIDSVEKNNDNIVVIFKSKRSYLVKSNGEISKQNSITISDLVVKNGESIITEESKSIALNTPLTINFDASITEGNITNISPELPYTTNGTETSKTFIITGTGGVTKEYKVNLKGYYNIPDLKVGDFVKYELSAIDNSKVTTLNSDVNTYSGESSTQTISRTGTVTENGKEYLICRVLEMDSNGNPTKLISANGVNKLKLSGANGYNNAVYLINEMCKTLYSGNQGTTTSLTIENLENNYFDSTALTTEKGSDYGKKFRYTGSNSKYPLLATKEKRMGINTETETVDGNTFNILNTSNTVLDLSEQERSDLESGGGTTKSATNGITVTKTNYIFYAGDSNYKNAILNNIIHMSPTENGSDTTAVTAYWMASRYVNARSSNCNFSVRYVESGFISGNGMFRSDNTGSSVQYAVRPVINLNSGIQTEYSAKYNNTYNIWNLK